MSPKNPKREQVAGWIKAVLRDEIMHRCPKCFNFDEHSDEHFQDHHINGDCSISKYWNLIRLCKSCHSECNTQMNKTKLADDIKRLKKILFRQFIGPASYDLLLQMYEHESVLALPYTARTLLDLKLAEVEQENPGSFGSAKAKPTFTVYRLTEQGKEWARELNLSWKQER